MTRGCIQSLARIGLPMTDANGESLPLSAGPFPAPALSKLIYVSPAHWAACFSGVTPTLSHSRRHGPTLDIFKFSSTLQASRAFNHTR